MSPSFMKKNWTHEDKMMLITLAEKYDVLWNTSYPFYRELNQRRHALDEIKVMLGNSYCVDDINSQWRNLKDVFYKKKSIMEQKMQTGEVPSEPIWRYYQPLKFLLSCEEDRKNILKRRHNGNFQLDQLSQLRLKRKHQLMDQPFGLPSSSSQLDSLAPFEDVCREYEKFATNGRKSLNCNLDQVDFARSQKINLDNLGQRVASARGNRSTTSNGAIKKEMDEEDSALDSRDEDLDCSEYDSLMEQQHMCFDVDDDDDRQDCEKDKIIPTSMSTTDTLLAAATAASISSSNKRCLRLSPPSAINSATSSINRLPNTSSQFNGQARGVASESRQKPKVFAPIQPASSVTAPKVNPAMRMQKFGGQQAPPIRPIGLNNLDQFNNPSTSQHLGEFPSSKDAKKKQMNNNCTPVIVTGNASATPTVTCTSTARDNTKLKPGVADGVNDGRNKFKYFGNYVEIALLDMHQQSPALARQLVQSIYQTIADHQCQLRD